MKTIIKKITVFIICLVFINMLGFAQEIVAHRGASYKAPENTLASVELGYEMAADAVEIDIHLSADNRIMVNHDYDTKRTSGKPGLIIAETSSEELRKLDVGIWKDPKFAEEKMPFLEEVIEIVPEGKKLFVEMKSSVEIVPYLQQIIDNSSIQRQLVLISFDKEAILLAKQRMPDIPAFWLLHNYKDYQLEEAISIAKANGLQGLDVHYKLVDQDFMKKMKAANLEVYVYTVNNPAEAKKLWKLGVKGITTDRPQFIYEHLKEL